MSRKGRKEGRTKERKERRKGRKLMHINVPVVTVTLL